MMSFLYILYLLNKQLNNSGKCFFRSIMDLKATNKRVSGRILIARMKGWKKVP